MQNETGQSGEKEDGAKERCDYFWHTYYGFPSEMLGWALLAVTLLYSLFVIFVAVGIL